MLSKLALPNKLRAMNTNQTTSSTSTHQELAESIGMDALSEAFRTAMLNIMHGAVSQCHEDTHLECLKEARLCVQRFHACASLLRKPMESASTQ